MLRAVHPLGGFFGCASAIWALLPLYVAQVQGLSSASFGPMHWVETFRARDWHELQRGIHRLNPADAKQSFGRARTTKARNRPG